MKRPESSTREGYSSDFCGFVLWHYLTSLSDPQCAKASRYRDLNDLKTEIYQRTLRSSVASPGHGIC